MKAFLKNFLKVINEKRKGKYTIKWDTEGIPGIYIEFNFELINSSEVYRDIAKALNSTMTKGVKNKVIERLAEISNIAINPIDKSDIKTRSATIYRSIYRYKHITI